MTIENLKLDSWVEIIILCDNNNASNIHRKTGITLAHTFDIIKLLESKGLVKTNKVGRIKHISLTMKGKTTVEKLNYIKQSIK
jgi:predicted transcriptional regulator